MKNGSVLVAFSRFMDFRSFASAESEEDGEADDDFFGLGLQFQQKQLPHKQLQQQPPPQEQLQQQQPPPQQQQHPASAVQPCPNASGGSNVASPPSVRKAAVDILQANLYDFNRITQAQVHKLTDEEDREALRRQNSKLYLNYIFGRYLTSITEEEQRLWLEPLGAGAHRGPLNRLAFSDSPDQIVSFFFVQLFLADTTTLLFRSWDPFAFSSWTSSCSVCTWPSPPPSPTCRSDPGRRLPLPGRSSSTR